MGTISLKRVHETAMISSNNGLKNSLKNGGVGSMKAALM
jgi:hypothetical protein